jgi:hypothetical protein
VSRGTQRAQLSRIGLGQLAALAPPHPRGALRQTRLPPRGAADERDELVVDEKRPAGELVAPPPIDVRCQRIVELPRQLDTDSAADHVMVEHEAGVQRGSQHHLARGGVGVERQRILGFEQQARHLQRRHQRTVAQLDRVRVDQSRIRQPVAGMGLLAAPGRRSEPFGGHSRSLRPLTPRSCCSPSAASSSPAGTC